MGIKLKQLLRESRLEQLYAEFKQHVRDYKLAKENGNEWAMEYAMKRMKLLAPEIKQERAKNPEELDRDRFLRHHYTGHISSTAYRKYEEDGGLSWLGSKSKYPLLIEREKFGPYEVEFRGTNEKVEYTKVDKDGEIVRDESGRALAMSPEEVRAADLPETDDTIVAFVDDKPIGLASNEFGAVGIWVEGKYQRLGIGTKLLELHLEMRPRVKRGKGKIGQATDAGVNLMKAYHRKMAKKHGPEWFKNISGKND